MKRKCGKEVFVSMKIKMNALEKLTNGNLLKKILKVKNGQDRAFPGSPSD